MASFRKEGLSLSTIIGEKTALKLTLLDIAESTIFWCIAPKLGQSPSKPQIILDEQSAQAEFLREKAKFLFLGFVVSTHFPHSVINKILCIH